MMSNLAAEDVRATYDAFAAVYDRYTGHHRQQEWMALVEALATEGGLAGNRLLDMACGTGNSFLALLDRYEVTACDLSPEMSALAAAKARGKADVFAADMRHLGVLGEFDVVQCLDDALNYLATTDDLTAAFQSAASNLAPGGRFVFDVNTLATYRSVFAGDHCWESAAGFFAWRGLGSAEAPPKVHSEAILEAFTPASAGWDRLTTRHRQRHFTHREVLDALSMAGLRVARLRGHHADGSGSGEVEELQHTKRLYVARLI